MPASNHQATNRKNVDGSQRSTWNAVWKGLLADPKFISLELHGQPVHAKFFGIVIRGEKKKPGNRVGLA